MSVVWLLQPRAETPRLILPGHAVAVGGRQHLVEQRAPPLLLALRQERVRRPQVAPDQARMRELCSTSCGRTSPSSTLTERVQSVESMLHQSGIRCLQCIIFFLSTL